MKINSSPRTVSSSRSIKYRPSGWKVHEFEVWSGGVVCRGAALHAEGSVLVWVGAGAGAAPCLGEVALGMPAALGQVNSAALATTLLGCEGSTAPLALRLAASLSHPVYVCCGTTFDRFTLPIVERALVDQIKKETCMSVVPV